MADSFSPLLLGNELSVHEFLCNIAPPGLVGVLYHPFHNARRRRSALRLRNVRRAHLPRQQSLADLGYALAQERSDPEATFVDIAPVVHWS